MGFPAWTLGLINSPIGSIDRRFPKWWSDGEGGIDWDAPVGMPVTALADGTVQGAGYFCIAQKLFFSSTDACDHGVVTTRVTNQDGTQTDLYYQHIILDPSITPCAHGAASCGGQVVKKGQVIGHISNFGMLEVGVNVGNSPNPPPYPNGWGGIWGADKSPGPHVDPEAYIRSLIMGTNVTGTLAGGSTTPGGTPGAPGSSVDLLASLHQAGTSIGVFALALVLFGFGIYLLFKRQIDAKVTGGAKKAAEVAVLA